MLLRGCTALALVAFLTWPVFGYTADSVSMGDQPVAGVSADQYYIEMTVTRHGELVSESQVTCIGGAPASICNTRTYAQSDAAREQVTWYLRDPLWIELTPPATPGVDLGAILDAQPESKASLQSGVTAPDLRQILEPIARQISFAGIQGVIYWPGSGEITLRVWCEKSADFNDVDQAQDPLNMTQKGYVLPPGYVYLGSASYSVTCPTLEPIVIEVEDADVVGQAE